MSTEYRAIIQQLDQLIALPSVSCTDPNLDQGNRAVIDLLASWLENLGFSIDIMPLSPSGHKANLIATLGKGDGGIVFSGHTDTVPYNAERWDSDPLKLAQKDDKLFGLGATDMKGFFPVVLNAIENLDLSKIRQPLIILATADEESTMDGARAIAAASKPKARAAIVGEPTGLKPIRMHKGIMMEKITVLGKAGHSSNPDLGHNAIETMHKVTGALLDYRNTMQQKYRHPEFDISFPTLNLGCIHGGDNPNRICNACEMQFDLRAIPGMDNEETRGELRQLVAKIAEQEGTEIHLESLFNGVNAFEQVASSELVRRTEQLTGYTAESVAFATEAPFLQTLGMETVILGPGSINQAHQPDEFLALEQIAPAITIYSQLIEQYCL